MTQEKTLGCVLLAAGSARRYGENKLLAALDGRSLVLRAMEAVPGRTNGTGGGSDCLPGNHAPCGGISLCRYLQ